MSASFPGCQNEELTTVCTGDPTSIASAFRLQCGGRKSLSFHRMSRQTPTSSPAVVLPFSCAQRECARGETEKSNLAKQMSSFSRTCRQSKNSGSRFCAALSFLASCTHEKRKVVFFSTKAENRYLSLGAPSDQRRWLHVDGPGGESMWINPRGIVALICSIHLLRPHSEHCLLFHFLGLIFNKCHFH